MLRDLSAESGPGTTDLLDILSEALSDVGHVRTAALMTGSQATVLKAASTANAIAHGLLERLGIDDLSVIDSLKSYDRLGRAMARATRLHPEIGSYIATELRLLGDEESADSLEAFASQILNNTMEVTS